MPAIELPTDLLAYIAPTAAAAFTLIYRLRRLRFLRDVYDAGGAKDVKIVAAALRFDIQPLVHRRNPAVAHSSKGSVESADAR
jgi:hypothetical protein